MVKRVHLNIKDISCDRCAYMCSKQQHLRLHNRLRHIESGSPSPQCTPNTKYVATHWKAALQSDQDDSSTDCDVEIQDKLKRKIAQCMHCSYSTTKAFHLATHVKAVHQKIKDFCCHLCNYKSSYKSDLLKHMKKHARKYEEKEVKLEEKSIKIITCLECSFMATGEKKLKQHMRRKHAAKCKDTQSDQDNSSPDCDAELQDKLKRNIAKCMLCSYSATKASNLATHVKAVHQKIKDFFCHLCNYKSSYKGDILKHMRKHAGKYEAKEIKLDEKNKGMITCFECSFMATGESKMKQHVEEVHLDILCQSVETFNNKYK
jgi:hypothetical protein